MSYPDGNWHSNTLPYRHAGDRPLLPAQQSPPKSAVHTPVGTASSSYHYSVWPTSPTAPIPGAGLGSTFGVWDTAMPHRALPNPVYEPAASYPGDAFDGPDILSPQEMDLSLDPWPGYDGGYASTFRDGRRNATSFTFGELLEKVFAFVNNFMDEASIDHRVESGEYHDYSRIGKTGIRANEVILIGLLQTGHTWHVILALTRRLAVPLPSSSI
ncbi:hypothetical protein FA95DRAFT_1613633 [Auriscalpium vulgare]|uniref:Uncharacterized protein n=1 Tax=Auriscalpium vulgare TaxID=40419 RepID=A0ACB8R3A9_9AGAM|nr:hypothetical protein FA95DRAFT_1613633 [Auriscalpium vulgare]